MTSKKSVTVVLAVAVMLSPSFWNCWHSFCLVFSAFDAVSVVMAKPSSL